MYSRFFGVGLDRRVLLPLLMLGGLVTSLALSGPPRVPRVPSIGGDPSPASAKSAITLLPVSSPAFAPHLPPPEPEAAAGSAVPVGSDRGGLDAAPCGEGMLLVEGDYCPALGHVCLKRLEGEVERCAEYAAPGICQGALQSKRFCIDRFEYPNLAGVRPVVMVNWHEAQAACEAEGKRLCTASEWTLACEGSERIPYPYGYTRDSTACNIDRPQPEVDADALLRPRAIASEVARLDQRVPSGQMSRCRSPYGVQDMTGNVDEWVVNERYFALAQPDNGERPFISALKGGYWGPVRNRCRATTTAHDEWFRYYQVGFRCCSNAPGPSDAP